MELVNPICAGLDVHKRDVKVCLVWRDAHGRRQQVVRTYGTMTPDLLALRDGLEDAGCRVVALESTGVYWQPVFNLLEDGFQVLLVNPRDLRHVPGRKTDVKDCEWIAQLLEHGLLTGSFIPPAEIRDLRDLTRYRRRLVQMRTSEINRLHKVLEQANLKLGSVASDVLGKSGRAMLDALLAGVLDPEQLADLARGQLRRKKAALEAALQGRFRAHHAGLLTKLLAHIDFLNESIAACEAEIDEACRPFADAVARLDTLTGVHKRAAQDLIAEIGLDMRRFPSHKHLCSWAKVCPGNNESAGKRQRAGTGKGNRWLRAILTECAQAAGRTKDTYLGSQYRQAARRKGRKHAASVVAHSLLEVAYFILRDGVEYHDLGPHYLDQLHQAQLVRYHVRRLEALGLQVDVHQLPLAA